MALGVKTGGRQKGARNKTYAVNKAQVDGGLMPIDFMLALLRNEDAPMDDRKWAANAAAPYVHAKLANVELGNKDNKPFQIVVSNSDLSLL
jgi:hypothetical protein